MLRACVFTYGKGWEQSLPYAEFSYNNGYQASLGMSPFEALYGRKCRTPLMWSEVGERVLVGPALIKEARASSRYPRKVESHPIPTKELCRQEQARSKLQSWRFRLPQGFTYSRDSKISGAWKVGPLVHWAVQSAEEGWSSSIPVGVCRTYTPGTHARKEEDRLLLEFPCNSTRTRSV
jgi:hypothetical protein